MPQHIANVHDGLERLHNDIELANAVAMLEESEEPDSELGGEYNEVLLSTGEEDVVLVVGDEEIVIA